MTLKLKFCIVLKSFSTHNFFKQNKNNLNRKICIGGTNNAFDKI